MGTAVRKGETFAASKFEICIKYLERKKILNKCINNNSVPFICNSPAVIAFTDQVM